MKKATTATKKPTASKATGADRPTSAKPTAGTKTTSTTKSTTTTTKATSKTTTDTKTTTKPTTTVPATPKTPKAPTTPKTPKPPATPKAPTTPKATKPATSRPATATTKTTTTTTSKPAATKRPATASATSTTKAAATTKAAPATSRPSTARPATAKATTTTTKTKTSTSTTSKPAATKATATKPGPASSRPATASVSPRESAASGSASARPSTSTAPSLARSTSSGSKPTSSAPAKKATTPRGTASTAKSPRDPLAGGHPLLLKSPSSEPPQKSPRKSPRHNVASLSRTSTAPELPIQDPTRQHLTAGSRSVSVGGLQSNMTRAAPAGRRKPTVNPVKSRKDTPTPVREIVPQQRAAAGLLNGMGLLASVGGEGQEFGQVQLRKVSDDKPKPLLIRVKGRRNVTARAVETSLKSLNKGDAFVLIDPSSRTVFEWRGSTANKMEVAKAMDIAGRVKNKEFGGRADIFVLEDGKTDQNPKFWELIGGKGNVAPAETVGDDEDEDKIVRQDYLFGVSEKTPGKPELYQIAKSRFNKDMLQTGQVFLLDCLTELYMWVGRGCSNSHRSLIALKAQEAITAVKVRPKWVGITRVIEGAEPEIFKEKFCDWPNTLPITMAAIAKGNVAAKVAIKFDVATMFVSPKREDRNIDDGSGKIEIWRVKDHAKEAVDANMYGQFFDSESYVILYKYMIKNREVFIIYFWQGKKSSIHEKGSSALLTIDLDDSIGGNATQIRVVQNKEPKHFMKLFKGFIIVHKACETEDGASAVPETALYQIRGCNHVGDSCDTRAVQLDSPSVKYLNTNDIFLLNTPEKQLIWLGANSCKFLVISQEVLVQLGNSIKGSREQVFIREGEEPPEFWEYMGEGDYYKTAWKWMPRMFHCSSASGAFKVEEVIEWDQEDLDPGHHHILDTSSSIYLWTGQRAVNVEEEKKLSLQAALDYARLHPLRLSSPSPPSSPDKILSVIALKEPVGFTGVFNAWDSSRAKTNGENDILRVEDLLKDLTRNYTLAELLNAPKMLDNSKLESYLSTEEFGSVFKMDKEAFAAQPLWKREQQKKNVGLY